MYTLLMKDGDNDDTSVIHFENDDNMNQDGTDTRGDSITQDVNESNNDTAILEAVANPSENNLWIDNTLASNNENMSGDENDKTGSLDSNGNLNSSDSFNGMPSDYIFPSFFVFMLWGPFVPSDKRLTLLLTTTKDKSKEKGSREEERKKQLNNRRDDAFTDVTAARGFSTEQRIDIENLNVKKQSLLDRQRESRIVGFSIEEAALSRQVESAERRAALRCPEYDPVNIHW